MNSTAADSLLEYRNCPNCGEDDYRVLFDSNMGLGDLEGRVEAVYMLPGDKYGRHVKCRNCDLVYVNPIEKSARINESYTRMQSGDAPLIHRSRLRSASSQVALVRKRDGGRHVLDVGCGEGFFLHSAAKAGYVGRGIELSKDAVDYARNELAVDVEQGAFDEAGIKDGCFDVVTMWQVLEHVPDPLGILGEAHRVLRPGGLVIASTPDIGGIAARGLRKRWWNIRRIHVNQFTRRTLVSMVENAGFRHVCATSYVEFISLSMIVVPLLRHWKLFKRFRGALCPTSPVGKVMDWIVFPYPAWLDSCIVVGFR